MSAASPDNDRRTLRPGGYHDASERFRVPGAEILSHDTWADEDEKCPSCGAEVSANQAQCRACGQWLERCSRSCSSCASPTCIGGGRR